ncbi:MAG: hypothetical protein VX035_08235, partial [Planctomycetota bacterium]|nr:hypothetical protein [Planctomycetota bacterium]
MKLEFMHGNQAEEEFLNIFFAVLLPQFFGGAFVQNFSAVHDGDPVTESFDFPHYVTGEYYSFSRLTKAGKRTQQLTGDDDVEPCIRLVKN